ncbi:hypothetical protein DFH27DRAFT_546217 [Peziza echinospora]|nr:hypothetical protein DFH27DRAFT_546217 [Peziza echinospora]
MQGFNMGRYVPPDQEGVQSGNQLHRKKAPGVHGNTLTVRFEMPFNIFCNHCNGHIAQGVRFNAEKTRVGQYFTTPIWGFRMKHNVCGGAIVIHTDPKNTAYVVVEGAKKQDTGEDSGTGVIRVKPLPGEEDAESAGVMGKLEKAAEEAKRKAIDEPRIEELRRLSERQWADPYEHSRKMRKIFRAERNRLNAQAASAGAIQDRLGLSIPLLEESKEDSIRAKAVEFEPEEGGEEERIVEAKSGPMFAHQSSGSTNYSLPGGGGKGDMMHTSHSRGTRTGRGESAAAGGGGGSSSISKGKRKLTKAEILAEQTRERLENKLRRNTRLRMDPFLVGGTKDGVGSASGSDTGGGDGSGGGSKKSLDPPAFKLKKRKSDVLFHPSPPAPEKAQPTTENTLQKQLSVSTVPEGPGASRANSATSSPQPHPLLPLKQHALVDYGSDDDDSD